MPLQEPTFSEEHKQKCTEVPAGETQVKVAKNVFSEAQVGDRVEALWFGDKKFYTAEVVHKYPNNTYSVKFVGDASGKKHVLKPSQMRKPTGDADKLLRLSPPAPSTSSSKQSPPPPEPLGVDLLSKDRTWNIFVGDLPHETRDQDLYDIFGACGQIVSAKVIKKVRKPSHRLFGFVNFSTSQGQKKALDLHGAVIKGTPLVVKKQHEVSHTRQEFDSRRSLFVGNMPRTITEKKLREELSKIGPPISDLRLKNGYGFVLYRDVATTKKAFEMLSNASVQKSKLNVQYTRTWQGRRQGKRQHDMTLSDLHDSQPSKPSTSMTAEQEALRRTIYVTQLSEQTMEEELSQFFSQIGAITRVSMHRANGAFGPSSAFVEFEHLHHADDAVRQANGHAMHARRMHIEIASSRYRAPPPAPPPLLPSPMPARPMPSHSHPLAIQTLPHRSPANSDITRWLQAAFEMGRRQQDVSKSPLLAPSAGLDPRLSMSLAIASRSPSPYPVPPPYNHPLAAPSPPAANHIRRGSHSHSRSPLAPPSSPRCLPSHLPRHTTTKTPSNSSSRRVSPPIRIPPAPMMHSAPPAKPETYPGSSPYASAWRNYYAELARRRTTAAAPQSVYAAKAYAHLATPA